MNKFTKTKAIAKLKELIAAANTVSQRPRHSPEFKKWNRDTQVALGYIFGNESRHIEDFKNIHYSLGAFSSNTPDRAFDEAFIKGLENAKAILESMIQEVEQYWDEDSEPTSKNKSKKTSKNTSKVFLVHGHDAGAKEEVARFITKLGLTPIILHEQPNQGKTIIEKFEQYADVSYAIVLFTPDDVGAAAGQSNSLNKRARQNVLLEFGFFLGQLGRDRVCGIVKDTIEVPTDYSGVIYIPFDSEGAWKFSLVKELKAARFSIDANSAF